MVKNFTEYIMPSFNTWLKWYTHAHTRTMYNAHVHAVLLIISTCMYNIMHSHDVHTHKGTVIKVLDKSIGCVCTCTSCTSASKQGLLCTFPHLYLHTPIRANCCGLATHITSVRSIALRSNTHCSQCLSIPFIVWYLYMLEFFFFFFF